MKKQIALFLAAVGTVNILPFSVCSAQGENSVKSFFEDFDSYSTVEFYNTETGKADGAAISFTDSTGSSIKNARLINAKPADGDYSALIGENAVYSKGTASVYEANAANNLFVYDAKGNRVSGGLDGFYGYLTELTNSEYNQYNRRLTVIDDTSIDNTSKNKKSGNKILQLCPKTENSEAIFGKNNIDLNGYSSLSVRFAFASVPVGAVRIAENRTGATKCDSTYDLVSFAQSETGADIIFNGQTVGTISYPSDVTKIEKWYTMRVSVDCGGEQPRYKVHVSNDTDRTNIVDTDWVSMSGFELKADTAYGIEIAAKATAGKVTKLVLDDMRFTKSTYTEDFESYNTNAVSYKTLGTGTNDELRNGMNGNLNDTRYYSNGEFEGNAAYNLYVYNSLGEKVYNGLPGWQGYVSNSSASYSTYTTDLSTRKLSVIDDSNNKILVMNPKKVTTSGGVVCTESYFGMEDADFTDGTVISVDVISRFTGQDGDSFKLQLTSGRSRLANHTNWVYDGNSFGSTYDVIELKKTADGGNIIFGGEVIGTYNTNTKYRIEYTVDRTSQTPKHSVRVLDGDTVAAYSKMQDMKNLPEGFFVNGVTGFRFINAVSSEDADGKSKRFELDNITVDKFLNQHTSLAYTGTAENKATVVLNNDSGLKNAVVLCAVYNNDGTDTMQTIMFKNVSPSFGEADEITFDIPSEYNTSAYKAKFFVWDSFAGLTPLVNSIEVQLGE